MTALFLINIECQSRICHNAINFWIIFFSTSMYDKKLIFLPSPMIPSTHGRKCLFVRGGV